MVKGAGGGGSQPKAKTETETEVLDDGGLILYLGEMTGKSKPVVVFFSLPTAKVREYEQGEAFEAYSRGEISPETPAWMGGMKEWGTAEGVLSTLTYGRPVRARPRFIAACAISVLGSILLAGCMIAEALGLLDVGGRRGELSAALLIVFISAMVVVWLGAWIAGESEKRTGCALSTIRAVHLNKDGRFRFRMMPLARYWTGFRREQTMPSHPGKSPLGGV